jgi:hypothetical protein
MIFNFRFLIHIFIIALTLMLFPVSPMQGSALSDCHNAISPNDIKSDDIKELLFSVDGKFFEQEKKDLNKPQLQKDIISKLKKKGINAAIVEKKKLIKNSMYIKVRIHSIMLERQVYLCSAEIIQRLSSKKECTVVKYTNVASLAKQIQPLLSDIINQLLRDIQ